MSAHGLGSLGAVFIAAGAAVLAFTVFRDLVLRDSHDSFSDSSVRGIQAAATLGAVGTALGAAGVAVHLNK